MLGRTYPSPIPALDYPSSSKILSFGVHISMFATRFWTLRLLEASWEFRTFLTECDNFAQFWQIFSNFEQFRAILGNFGRSWDSLGRSWALLGRSWGALGTLLGALGRLLDASWTPMRRNLKKCRGGWNSWASTWLPKSSQVGSKIVKKIDVKSNIDFEAIFPRFFHVFQRFPGQNKNRRFRKN